MKARQGIWLTTIVVVASLFVAGCTEDPVYESRAVEVIVTDLPAIDPSDGQYQLWFSYPEDGTAGKDNAVQHGDAHYVSMGSFVVDESGAILGTGGDPANFSIPDGYNPNILIDALLTIEAPGTPAVTPGARFLSGPFTGNDEQGTASLMIGGKDAFDSGFDTINLSGFIRLLTPSTAQTNDDEMGIWFIDGTGLPALSLDTLPIVEDNTDWIYEAWVFDTLSGQRRYTSLGQFRNPNLKDLNGAGPNAGPETVTLSAPGEDFVTGETKTLNDGSYGVLVSLQPETPGMEKPFHGLLILYSVPTGTTAFSAVPLAIAPGQPTVNLQVNR